MAKIIPKFPEASFFPLPWQIMWEIMPNPGKIRIYLQGGRRIRKGVGIGLDFLPLLGQKRMYLGFDLLIVWRLPLLELVMIVVVIGL
jgi:hypothetical protein